MSDPDKWMSRKLLFSLVAFIVSSILVYSGKVAGSEWMAVCSAVVTVYLGGQAYVDRASK